MTAKLQCWAHLCENGTSSSIEQCKEREESTHKIDEPIGPFKKIRFVIHKDRYQAYVRQRETTLFRIGGLELYGHLCKLNADGLCMKAILSCNNGRCMSHSFMFISNCFIFLVI